MQSIDKVVVSTEYGIRRTEYGERTSGMASRPLNAEGSVGWVRVRGGCRDCTSGVQPSLDADAATTRQIHRYAASVADLGNLYFVHKVGIFLSFISLRTREYYGDITDISLALRAEYHAEDQR